jgi:hypothetical protein
MPFFYFDTRNDEAITDDEGFDLPSIEHAKAEATGYLIEAAKSHMTPDRERQEIICTVKDEKKKTLLRLRLVLEIAEAAN